MRESHKEGVSLKRDEFSIADRAYFMLAESTAT